jgi:TatD DNase family protein
MQQLVDTHCHIHSDDYPLSPDEVIENARRVGVNRLLCVGTSVADSKQAISFVANHPGCWASIGIHPHEAQKDRELFKEFASLVGTSKVVAVGECGLDYFYNHAPKKEQVTALRFQIELALEYDLPLIFHVRDAFDDFRLVIGEYHGIRGVLHSFTDTQQHLEWALAEGLYIGMNGIMTFTKKDWQLELARSIPLERIVLETDAPYLTPAPKRGNINEPANVQLVGEFLAKLRKESYDDFAQTTTQNAINLFSLND